MKTITKTPKTIKRFALILLTLVAVISLNSCEDETTVAEQDPASFLKNYSIFRTNGKYIVTYQTPQNVNTTISELEKGIHNIFFFQEQGVPLETHTQTYPLDTLQLNFVTQNAKLPVITIKDKKSDASATGRTGGVTELLNWYTLKKDTEDANTYKMNFEVPAGVEVTFNRNAEGIHEVHLIQGGASAITTTSYNQTYNKEEGVNLVIEFVNHRNTTARTEEEETRYPIVVVIGDDEGGQ